MAQPHMPRQIGFEILSLATAHGLGIARQDQLILWPQIQQIAHLAEPRAEKPVQRGNLFRRRQPGMDMLARPDEPQGTRPGQHPVKKRAIGRDIGALVGTVGESQAAALQFRPDCRATCLKRGDCEFELAAEFRVERRI